MRDRVYNDIEVDVYMYKCAVYGIFGANIFGAGCSV